MSFSLFWSTPSHRKFLSITELATPLGRFLVFLWGLGAQCAWISLCFSVFLCRVQNYVFPLVSCRSNFGLSLSFYPLSIHFPWFLPHNFVYIRGLSEQSHIHTGFLQIVAYASLLTMIWMFERCWVKFECCWVFLGATGVCLLPLFLNKDLSHLLFS